MSRIVVTKSGASTHSKSSASKSKSNSAPVRKGPSAKKPFASKQVSVQMPTYAEAWNQLEKAMEAGFPLEAIALVEGILADQLALYLSGPLMKKPITKDRGGNWPVFYALVEKWKTELRGQKLPDNEFAQVKGLVRGITQWRDTFASTVQAWVRANPATKPKLMFEAMEAAEKGAQLAEELSNWHVAALQK